MARLMLERMMTGAGAQLDLIKLPNAADAKEATPGDGFAPPLAIASSQVRRGVECIL